MRPVAHCVTSPHEPILVRLTRVIFTTSGLLLPGSVVDCGAHSGGEACLYATLAPERTVHAVEPLVANLNAIRRTYGSITNLKPFFGALGSSDRLTTIGPHTGSMLLNVWSQRTVVNESSRTFPVRRLDGLFEGVWAGERLAFGHFDVEGSECLCIRVSNVRGIHTIVGAHCASQMTQVSDLHPLTGQLCIRSCAQMTCFKARWP